MSKDSPYVTSVFIWDSSTISQAFQAYPHDVFQSFWQRFDPLVQSGRLTSVREVKLEIDASSKDVVRASISYLENLNPSFFLEPTEDEQSLVKQLTNDPKLSSASNRWTNKPRPDADPYVIARARASSPAGIVVTEESQSLDKTATIPAVCRYVGLHFLHSIR